MPHHDPTNPRRSKWLWLFLPLWLPLLLIVIVVVGPFLGITLVWTICAGLWRKWSLTIEMRRRKRLLFWSSLEAKLQSGIGGTLIVNFPTLGWNLTDVWWTSESVSDAAAAAHLAVPQTEIKDMTDEESQAWLNNTAFDHWCASRFLTGPDSSALLVSSTLTIWASRRTLSRIRVLQQQFPSLILVKIMTGKGPPPA